MAAAKSSGAVDRSSLQRGLRMDARACFCRRGGRQARLSGSEFIRPSGCRGHAEYVSALRGFSTRVGPFQGVQVIEDDSFPTKFEPHHFFGEERSVLAELDVALAWKAPEALIRGHTTRIPSPDFPLA